MHAKRYHNIIDIEQCNDNIVDKQKIREFVEELAATIKMHILEGPIVAEGVPENPGITSVAIVDFSHITIHTFSKYSEALIDVFSCKPYEREKVVGLCKKYFTDKKSVIYKKEVSWG